MRIELDFHLHSKTCGHMFIDVEAKDQLLEFLKTAVVDSSLILPKGSPELHLKCIQVQSAESFKQRRALLKKTSRIKDAVGLLSCAIISLIGVSVGSFLASLTWMWLTR